MHKPQSELNKKLYSAAKQVTVGAEYYHYKNPDKTYQVIDLAIMEADESICVIYQARYGEKLIFVRPLSSWLKKVDWQGKTVKRFTLINT